MAPVEALMATFSDFKFLWKNYFDKFFEGELSYIKGGTIRPKLG